MNLRRMARLCGVVLCFEALLMLAPFLLSLFTGEGDAPAFLLSFAIAGGVGATLLILVPSKGGNPVQSREGYVAVAVCWLALVTVGALPFYLSGVLPGVVDAWFESVSGFTTTSATLFTNVEGLPRGILLWRSLTNWLGGLGVLVIAMAFFAQLGIGSQVLLRAESPGPIKGKFLPKFGQTARVMFAIYAVLTAVLILLLILLGMPVLDAFIHGFSTVATGGFSSQSASIAAYSSTPIPDVMAVFMLLSGVNFGVYFLLLSGEIKKALRSEELRLYLLLILCSTLVVAVDIRGLFEGFSSAMRHAFFQVASMMTTSGFSTHDFATWPRMSQNLLIVLTLVGGCAASTTGGFKVLRVLMLGKTIDREVDHIIHPRMVRSIKLDGKAVDAEVVTSVLVFTACLLALVVLGLLLVSINGFDLTTTLTAVLTCVSNAGSGLGQVGPLGNYAGFSAFSKVVLSILMMFGRLEIFPMLMLFSLVIKGKKAGGFA